jgi:hypothetical protein
VAVVVAFFICWAPFHSQRLMVIYMKQENHTPAFASVFFYYLSGTLYYVSSVINPILYNIMSLKFRQAFHNTIFRPCQRRHKKRASLKTYRFGTRARGGEGVGGGPQGDTNLTLMQAHLLQGLGKKLPVPQRAHKCFYKYTHGRAGAGGGAGSGAGDRERSENNSATTRQECDEIVMNELKIFHSYNPHSSTASTNANNRPYHSFA